MNPGGGPDRDDTGLPPVDVEIPDDARELDRDVQAYRRELRARRRRLRSVRLHGVLGRDGMVMPLLICCLVFALITGTLLTLFTSTSIEPILPGAAKHGTTANPTASTPSAPAATAAPGQLLSAPVEVAGHARKVSALGPAILLVAPAGCGCDATISQLASLAAGAHEATYLVTDPGRARQSARLAGQLGHGLTSASDLSRVLTGNGYPHSGLTAILVTHSGVVSYVQQVRGGTDLGRLVDLV